jgi:hypothetical protein
MMSRRGQEAEIQKVLAENEGEQDTKTGFARILE